MKFYLGVHEPPMLEKAEVPLFISYQRLLRQPKRDRQPTCEWSLDSGGFSEIAKHGKWVITPDQYIQDVGRYMDWGGLNWAAPQDWMVEPHMIEKTGLSVAEHQRLTVDNFIYLRDEAPDLPFIPVIQGWSMRDYITCLDMYVEEGIDLTKQATVGVGSVCRRQATYEIEAIMSQLYEQGLNNIHGFGIKTSGLAKYGQFLQSADSMAWSYAARMGVGERCDWCKSNNLSKRKSCANCLGYALTWREKVVNSPLGTIDEREWL
tara:strand:+ start:7418 stop:8206 length:789 start_codon:yes stop_codon:yes gene_type:complete